MTVHAAPSASDGGHRVAGNVLLALATIAVTLGAAEWVARRFAPPLFSAVRFGNEHCWQRSALLGHENRPKCVGRDGTAVVRINSLGLRGPELRQDGAVRILALGDSCTFGYMVDETASYPAVLQRLLDERGGPVRYEVVNAGVEGHTSLQGLIYLRERGLALRPVSVIFGYGFNDGIPEGNVAAWIRRQRRLFPFFTFSDWLSERSTLWLWVLSRPPRRGLELRVTPDEYEANVKEIVRLTRKSGASTLALSFWTTQRPPYGDALRRATEPLGVPVIVYDGPVLDAVHPTVAGYAQLASRILDRLVADGDVQ